MILEALLSSIATFTTMNLKKTEVESIAAIARHQAYTSTVKSTITRLSSEVVLLVQTPLFFSATSTIIPPTYEEGA
jgi:hypothetical protein